MHRRIGKVSILLPGALQPNFASIHCASVSQVTTAESTFMLRADLLSTTQLFL